MKFQLAIVLSALALASNTQSNYEVQCPASTEYNKAKGACENPCPNDVTTAAFEERLDENTIICKCSANFAWDIYKQNCFAPCPTSPGYASFDGFTEDGPKCTCPSGYKLNRKGNYGKGSCDKVEVAKPKTTSSPYSGYGGYSGYSGYSGYKGYSGYGSKSPYSDYMSRIRRRYPTTSYFRKRY